MDIGPSGSSTRLGGPGNGFDSHRKITNQRNHVIGGWDLGEDLENLNDRLDCAFALIRENMVVICPIKGWRPRVVFKPNGDN